MTSLGRQRRTQSLARQRRCPQCTRGIIETNGYAADGRPSYACGSCGYVFTNGHGGEDWDARERRAVMLSDEIECTCASCRRAKRLADSKKKREGHS